MISSLKIFDVLTLAAAVIELVYFCSCMCEYVVWLTVIGETTGACSSFYSFVINLVNIVVSLT